MFLRRPAEPVGRQVDGVFRRRDRGEVRLTRADQDAFAAESVRRAQRAVREGDFAARDRPGHGQDVARANADRDRTKRRLRSTSRRFPSLKPAFGKDGTVTAASSSSISDGAAAHRARERGGCDRGGPATRSHGSSRMRATRRHRNGSRPRPPLRSAKRSIAPAGTSAMSISSKSTKRSRASTMAAMQDLGPAAREGQRQRRGLRARSSDRRDRCATDHDARARAAQARPASRRRVAVHRRRRGLRGRHRNHPLSDTNGPRHRAPSPHLQSRPDRIQQQPETRKCS